MNLFEEDLSGAMLYIMMFVTEFLGRGFVTSGVVDFIVIFKYEAVFSLVHTAEFATLLNRQSVFWLKASLTIKFGLKKISKYAPVLVS